MESQRLAKSQKKLKIVRSEDLGHPHEVRGIHRDLEKRNPGNREIETHVDVVGWSYYDGGS